jgi:hypothetical protein
MSVVDDDASPPEETADVGLPVEAIADPRLLSLVQNRFHPDIARTHSLPTYAGELPFHLDPAVWRTGFLSVEDGGAPLALREAMNELTPQSLLRDLFRPEYSEAPVPLDLQELPLDPGGRRAYAELHAALAREPVPVLPRSVHLLAEEREKWRTFLREPWQPFLRDDQPRKEVWVALEPSLSA